MRTNGTNLRWFQVGLSTALLIWLVSGAAIGLVLGPAIEHIVTAWWAPAKSSSPAEEQDRTELMRVLLSIKPDSFARGGFRSLNEVTNPKIIEQLDRLLAAAEQDFLRRHDASGQSRRTSSLEAPPPLQGPLP